MAQVWTGWLILLATAICTNAYYDYNDVVFTGDSSLRSYSQCYDDQTNIIDSIKLSCNSRDVIHISSIQVSASRTSGSYSCSNSYDLCTLRSSKLIDKCEGRKGSCTLRSYDLTDYCSSYKMNRARVTFQCVPGSSVHEMCDSQSSGTEVSYSTPVYFTTPDFTSAYSKYDSNDFCRCNVDSSASVDVLYEEIESYSDCLKFGINPSSYCSSSSSSLSQSFSGKFSWIFKTDSSITKRGAWFKLSTSSSSLKITCNPTAAEAGAVTGGVVAAGIVVVILVIIVLVRFTRDLRAPPRNPQTVSPMIITDTAPPHYTPAPTQGQVSVSNPASNSGGSVNPAYNGSGDGNPSTGN